MTTGHHRAFNEHAVESPQRSDGYFIRKIS